LHLTERQLGGYVARYKLSSRFATVALENHRLRLEIPGGPYYWFFATSETTFFLRTDEAEIKFQKDATGKVVEMAIHDSDGSVIRCPRLMPE
jgi:hypothetical protein